MVTTLEKCVSLAKQLEADNKQLKVKEDFLNAVEGGLTQRDSDLMEKEEDLEKREKKLLPSEKVFERDRICDKKTREAQQILDDVDQRSRNNTEANDQARREILALKESFEIKKEKFNKELLDFEEMQKDWKSKAIETLRAEL